MEQELQVLNKYLHPIILHSVKLSIKCEEATEGHDLLKSGYILRMKKRWDLGNKRYTLGERRREGSGARAPCA